MRPAPPGTPLPPVPTPRPFQHGVVYTETLYLWKIPENTSANLNFFPADVVKNPHLAATFPEPPGHNHPKVFQGGRL
jgi:hypothetical protein